jgi:class 3 adenylate cyclase
MPRCAACGEENPDRFRFCGACGAPLAPSRRQRGQERRLVTVLFSDLVGFTARSDQADPEDVGALLRPYHGRLRAEIERFGGTLDKFIGDAVMAVFGAPVAHEDDPERGVRCALGMLAAIAELQALLLERAGGNPLYAEEFTQLLADRDLLAGDRLAATTGIPVPETVEGLIAARLDTLAQERKALLQDAAVVGRVFWSGALAAIGGVEAAEVRPGLQVLERRQLVRQARTSSVEHQDEYGFWHALVRDVCYAQIPRAGRARRHRAAAEWLEGVAGDRVADLAEILAHHYRQALTHARAAGGHQAQADQLEGPTRRALVLAGDRAANLDIDRARTYYEQAIGLCPPDHPERPRLQVKAGWVAFQSGKLAEAAGAYEEAIAGLRGRQDVHVLGMALDRLATVRWNQGDTRGAREALVEGIEVLEREPPSPELCSLYAQMAVDRVMSGNDEEALGWAERALALADGLGGLPEVRLRALDARHGPLRPRRPRRRGGSARGAGVGP